MQLQIESNLNEWNYPGDKYWKLEDDKVASGYPRFIRNDWPGLPGSIDAAFTWTNGRTYFFKGSRYWRFTNFKADDDYPRDLSDGFAGVPEKIDTALVWSGNGKIYFFKGPLDAAAMISLFSLFFLFSSLLFRQEILEVRSFSASANQIHLSERYFQLGRASKWSRCRIPVYERLQLLLQEWPILEIQRQKF